MEIPNAFTRSLDMNATPFSSSSRRNLAYSWVAEYPMPSGGQMRLSPVDAGIRVAFLLPPPHGRRRPTSQEWNMEWAEAHVGIMLLSVALALGAGASSATVTSALICENAGGKYVDRVCMPGSPRKAEDMCEGFGGTYSAKEDLCKIPPRTP